MARGGRLARIDGRRGVLRSGNGRSVAITGAGSFLGRNLVRVLEYDDSVSRIVALDVNGSVGPGSKTRSYEVDPFGPQADLRTAEIFRAEKVDTLVHLALQKESARPARWEGGIRGAATRYLLHACRKHGLRRFVLCSSTLVYGARRSNPNFLTETDPTYGFPGSRFVVDRIDAENQLEAFARSSADCVVTTLRLATLLGPGIENLLTRWLSGRLVPTVMGYDPLLQFLHEVDAVAALKLAVDSDVSGTYNIVSDGVLSVSKVVKLAGRLAMPIPHSLLRRAGILLSETGISSVPPSLVDLLRYLCVADGLRARNDLGYVPAFSVRDAVLDFQCAMRLREARLLPGVA